MSLGRARGAVVLGQPLDLAVDVRLDSADDSGNACFEADVFHGDAQVAPNRVRVIVVAGGQQQEAVVRIRSSAVVDEPVVGVVLRSVCGQKASRRYDFLTDFPVETRAASVPTIIPAIVTAPAAAPAPAPAMDAPAPAPAPRPAPRPPVVRSAPSATTAPVVKAPPKPVAAPKPAPAKEPAVAPKPVVKPEVPDNKPRLKLEAAETPDERVVQLKSSTDLVVAPTEDPQKRAAAAAAWRELNNLPVENPQEKQRLLALEAESKALKALLAKSEADFKLRLEKLENNRFGEGLVYGLLTLLLAALAAAGFWWNRARQRGLATATDWAHHGEPSPEEMGRPSALSRPAKLATQQPPATLPGSAHDTHIDTEVDESLFEDLKKLTAVTAMPVKPAVAPAVAAAPARNLHADDFLDVQQHADFFVSLGQYDQAIGVLKKSIDESVEVNPLAYLELLKVYHTLGRQAEYNQQRDAFNRIFNCQLPVFPAFTSEGQTLENYPAVLRSIEAQWGKPEVLDFIESCLFRDPEAAPMPVFDLAAYRELLLLHAMAKSALRQTGGKRAMEARSRNSLPAALEPQLSQPGALEELPRETSFTQPMLLMPDPSAPERADVPPEPAVSSYRQPLDLDLDLNLDFSNSELLAMQQLPAASPPPPAPAPAASSPLMEPLDLDLDELMANPAATPTPPPPAPPVIDSNMLEFDLFDPKVEAKISPKSK
ncbi:hypothetical protein [Rhodoferax sp. OV413]|uniref:hypothetical protein n=1 Tax=Rhodoferax sp. OV413 TaxID=1855285 RepID=UPI00115FEEB0|nr:hypothetical protein [Rhodoferax sp. OV413]